ncbi:hypothetical protein RhiJN_22243 [Ceratobasidium sp. AG-Ba]|nr:hypothetical protein RhiJN_22243 [Ceratobasidium sp. AG-Ba]
MSSMFVPHSDPRPITICAFEISDSFLDTPTHHPLATKSAARICHPTAPLSASWTNSMLHLNADGYPTRALYYLHKRLLDVVKDPKPRNFILTTPPLSPLLTPPEPNNSLDMDDEDDSHTLEQTRVLERLCATIISRDYIRPPTPPMGQSPCHTPPRFIFCSESFDYDETTTQVARLLIRSDLCDAEDIDMLDMFEVELELELEKGA